MKLRVGGNDVDFGQSFTGNDDSLAGLYVDVKNTSDKTIVDLRLSIAFAADGPGRDKYIFRFHIQDVCALRRLLG